MSFNFQLQIWNKNLLHAQFLTLIKAYTFRATTKRKIQQLYSSLRFLGKSFLEHSVVAYGIFKNILMLIFPYMDSLALIERKYKNLLEMIECFFVVVYIMEMLIKERVFFNFF